MVLAYLAQAKLQMVIAMPLRQGTIQSQKLVRQIVAGDGVIYFEGVAQEGICLG